MAILRLKAATLLETLVAMIIVTLSIAIVWQVFLFSDIGNKTLLKSKADILARNIHQQSCLDQHFINHNQETKNFDIYTEYEPLRDAPELYLERIHFQNKNGKELFTFQYYIRIRD